MLRVGIIGTGLIAREHAQAITMLPQAVKLVAAADISPERLAEFSVLFELPRRYGSAEGLIADPEVELVTVATPPAQHEELVIASLEAGKYVLCEKPLAHSLASAERIAAAAGRHPGRLSVDYQLRYAPHYRRMLWLIENGWIGEPESAVVERHSYIPHSLVGNGSWWGNWEVAGGGVLVTQMIHELDIVLQAMGRPRSVMSRMDTRYTLVPSEDWIEVEVVLAAGGTIRCMGSVNSGQMREMMMIKGSLGTISPRLLSLGDLSREAQAVAAVDAALPETMPPSTSLPSRAMRKIGRLFGSAERPELSPHTLLYRDVARAADGGEPLPISASEALSSLELCAGAYEAAISGKEISLPLDRASAGYVGVTKARYDARKRLPPRMAAPSVLPKSSGVRVGLIGLDTSHASTFTDLLHNPYNPDHIPGAKVVAGFAGGSPDMPISASRVGAFSSELREKYGVPILDSPEAVADAADIVFILSSDGRTHPGLFRSIASSGKPVFIDKPFAISTADAEMIYAFAKNTGTKVFASSAYRYADDLVAGLNLIEESGEKIRSCKIHYWGQIQPTQGRFFWYGIHGAEMLLAVMGNGVAAVEAISTGSQDLLEIEHKDGRRSTLIACLDDAIFHASIDTDRRTHEIGIGGVVSARLLGGVLDVLTPGGFPQLWRASSAGSVTGRPSKTLDPGPSETLEVIALLDAAQRSYASQKRITL